MAEINYTTEKCWKIKDIFPITVFVKTSWTGEYYVIQAPVMGMSYETWQDLDSHLKVDVSSYDYENGHARFVSDNIDLIKEWERKNSDKIIVDYTTIKELA